MSQKRKTLTVKIITLFPPFIEAFVAAFGIVKRAIALNLLKLEAVNLRQFGLGERQVVDDRPYGGGVGMVLRPDVLFKAIIKAKGSPAAFPRGRGKRERVILLTPQGKRFDQSDAKRLAKYDRLILICGRYEGFDERVRKFVDEEISIGDYVLMGGELPALVISEAVIRLRPGILGKDESAVGESFAESLFKNHGRDLKKPMLEFPQYTKPEILEIRENRQKKSITKLRVPKVLLTGHHKNIQDWRQAEAHKRTKKRRPDLLQ